MNNIEKPLPGSRPNTSRQKPGLLLKSGLVSLGIALLLVFFGADLKLMSINGASEFIGAGFFLGLGGLFVLVLSYIFWRK